MKIAHVCSEYRPAISGVGQVVEELAKRQAKKGHEVHVYAPDWDKEKRIRKKEEIIDKVHVHRCRHIARIANFATIWPGVFPRLLREKFDIIHSHVFGHLHFVLAALAAKFSRARHIHTTHCPWTDAYRSIPGRMGMIASYNIFSRLGLKLTDKIIAITPWEFEFIKKYGGKEEQITNIPNGMSGEFFKKVKNNDFREVCKTRQISMFANFSNKKFENSNGENELFKFLFKEKRKIHGRIILFFGRLSITKGPDKFVEIAKLVLKEKKDVVFVIRGPDEGMKEIVKRSIGKENKIILLPETRERKEIIKMYRAADIFVIPSFREGLPLTLFEAMASGLPIIASPVNGIPYEMKEPENGFLVNYGDNERFAKRIMELLDNKKLKKKISLNNLEKAKNYNWDLISERTLDLYTHQLQKFSQGRKIIG